VPDAVTRDANNETEANEANAIIARLGMRQHVEGGYYAVRLELFHALTTAIDVPTLPISVCFLLFIADSRDRR